MKIHKTGRWLSFLLFLLIIISLFSCCRSDEDAIYDAAVSAQKAANAEARSELEAMQSSGTESSQAEAVSKEKQLSGELKLSLPIESPIWEDWASRFKAVHPDVKFQFEYTAPDRHVIPNDMEENYIRKTVTELASGEAADIIDLSLVSFYKYGKTGLFEDFNELMENDPEFDREDYYTNIFEALESDDGKLYAFPPYVGFSAIVFNRYMMHELDFDVEKEFSDGVDYNDVIDLYYKVVDAGLIDEDNSYFAEEQNKYFFEGFCIPLFLDEKNGEATFNSPEFIEYLEKTNALPFENTISQGFLFTGSPPLFTPKDYFCQRVVFDARSFDSVFTYPWAGNTKGILYKSKDGKVSFSTSNTLAIPKGGNTELAWEFIKFCVREADFPDDLNIASNADHIRKYCVAYFSGIPINRENCRQLFTAAYVKEVAEEVDEIANQLNVRTGNSTELMRNLKDIFISYYDNHLISAEECARQLQERAWIYLNE